MDKDFHTSTATEWFHCDRCHASVFRGQTYWFFRFAGTIDQLCKSCGDKRRTDIALANVAKAVGATEFHITR